MIQVSNLEDLDAVLPDLGYADSFQPGLRASLRKSTKVYKTESLADIPADLEAFNEKWGRGRIRKVPAPFKNAQEMKTWRKNTRMLLARAHGMAPSGHRTPVWIQFMEIVRNRQGRIGVIGPNSDITIDVVAGEASKAGIAPIDVDDDWIGRTSQKLSNGKRKPFRRGIEGINCLIERQSALPELAGMLPAAPLSQPPVLRSPTSVWRRHACHPGAAAIWAGFDEIMHLKKYGEAGPQIVGTPEEFKETSVDTYETALNWLLRELAALKMIDLADSPDLAEVITYPNLIAAVNHWKEDRMARGQDPNTSSPHAYVTKLVHLAVAYLGASPKEAAQMVRLRKQPAIRVKSVGVMSKARNQWIRNFAADLPKQELVAGLPEVLMKRSKSILARVGTSRPPRPGETMLALRMGVAALQSAILFRASPVRSTNMRTLRDKGDENELRMDERLTEIRLAIPGDQVKNGREIDEIADDDLAPILRWYLDEIRPKLIKSHPFGKNHVDSEYLFPSTSNGPMERSVFAMNFRTACQEVGLDMVMHQARHVCAYWILLVDPNAWGEVAALLRADELTVRKYYVWLDEKKASAAARDEAAREARRGPQASQGGLRGCRVIRPETWNAKPSRRRRSSTARPSGSSRGGTRTSLPAARPSRTSRTFTPSAAPRSSRRCSERSTSCVRNKPARSAWHSRRDARFPGGRPTPSRRSRHPGGWRSCRCRRISCRDDGDGRCARCAP